LEEQMRHFSFRYLLLNLTLLLGSVSGLLASAVLPTLPGVEMLADTDGLKKATRIGLGQPDYKNPLRNLSFSGYYRFLGFHRYLSDPYSVLAPKPRTISVGDGYREPLMLLNIVGTPVSGATFGTDILLFSPFNGSTAGNAISLNLGVNFYTSIKTNQGNFDVHLGGINWYRQSPLTVWTTDAFQRFSIFTRVPWEPANAVDFRYRTYFNQGAVSQDERFGQRAFQGIKLYGTQLPMGFTLSGFAGKMQNNTGTFLPDYAYGGRLAKEVGKKKHILSYNTFANSTQLDSISGASKSYGIHTLEGQFRSKGWYFRGEVGGGYYNSPSLDLGWGEGIDVELTTPKRITGIPLKFAAYRLAPEFVNVNASFLNTSVLAALTGIQGLGATTLTPFAGPMMDLGFMANNRQGASVNGELALGKLKINAGTGFSSELTRGNAAISYNHRINSLSVSRFAFFASNIGPYKHLNTYFRGAYEVVNIRENLDSLGLPLFSKHFNSTDLQLKYSSKLRDKNFFLFYLASYNNSQNFFSPLPVVTDRAFVRALYNEFDMYYQVHPKVMLCSYAGLERIKANMATDLDVVSGRPRDQLGWGLGLGTDIEISKTVGLFLRHQWYDFKDKSFELERYRGHETTMELKAFF
jgi:hypothetical protein